jgi:hypothetical protein
MIVRVTNLTKVKILAPNSASSKLNTRRRRIKLDIDQVAGGIKLLETGGYKILESGGYQLLENS